MDLITKDLSSSLILPLELVKDSLLSLANISLRHDRRGLSKHETEQLNRCIGSLTLTAESKQIYVDAVVTSLKNGNYDLVQRLVSGYIANDLSAVADSVLQKAICGYNEAFWGRSDEDSQLKEIVLLLISREARVNAVDEDGQTPLYYACKYGYAQIFEVLLDQGADLCTEHGFSDYDTRRSPHKAGKDLTLKQMNLLEVALSNHTQYEHSMPVSDWWKEQYRKSYGKIIKSLLAKGAMTSRSNPDLIRYLHLACYKGELPLVQQLLDLGIDMDALGGTTKNRLTFGSALQAAAVGGSVEVVRYLLQRGANPRTKSYCHHKSEKVTAITAAISMWLEGDSTRQETLEACELMVLAGVESCDCQIVMEECVKEDEIDVLRRILQQGYMLDKVPLCKNLGMIRLLLHHGVALDENAILDHAVSTGSLPMLDYLQNECSFSVGIDRLEDISRQLIQGKRKDFLLKLMTGFDDWLNTVFPSMTPGKTCTNLLRLACYSEDTEMIQFFLDHGVDTNCPAIGETVLSYYMRRPMNDLQSYMVVGGQIAYRNTTCACEENFWMLLNASNFDEIENLGASLSMEISVLQSLAEEKPSLAISKAEFRIPPPSEQIPGEDFVYLSDVQADLIPTEPFLYTQLQGVNQIRLLELLPSQHVDDSIVTQLSHYELAQVPEYEVLSCVWEGANTSVEVSINNKVFDVAFNLWQAIRQLRLENESRLIWIDAICIDQANITEKNRQPDQVRTIYKKASRTLAWIGEEADQSDLVFDHIEQWPPNAYDEVWDNRRRRRQRPPNYEGETMEAFLALCCRPWFFRAQAVQERFLAKEILILCGTRSANLSSLLRAAHCGSRNHPIHGVSLISHIYALNTCSAYGTEADVQFSRLGDAVDLRDKVYGALGLYDQTPIRVDYALDIEQVYCDYTQFVITRFSDLYPLHHSGTRRNLKRLPSWVPDYSVSHPIGVLPDILRGMIGRPCTPRETILFDGNKLIVRGKCLDRILTIGSEMQAHAEFIRGGARFTQILEEWEEMALSESRHSGISLINAFCTTLIAKDLSRRDHSPVSTIANRCTREYALWNMRYGAGRLRNANQDTFQKLDLLWAFIAQANKDRRAEYCWDSSCMEEACYGRCFFVSENGSLGLAPPTARPGDSVVYLFAGRFPFVVRKADAGTYTLVGDCYWHDFNEWDFVSEESRSNAEEFIIS